jgi:hypothetical protein
MGSDQTGHVGERASQPRIAGSGQDVASDVDDLDVFSAAPGGRRDQLIGQPLSAGDRV